MTRPLPVLTIGDLPTLRKLAYITRQLYDDGAPEVLDDQGRLFIESLMRYAAEFHERLVRELEAIEHNQNVRKN